MEFKLDLLNHASSENSIDQLKITYVSASDEGKAEFWKVESMDSLLVRMCIDAATQSADAVEMWRRQRRTLARMPSHLAEALFRQLLSRRLIFPELLEVFKYSVEEIDLSGQSCVDAEWMAYLGAYQYLHSIILANCHKMNNSALWNISGMTNLKEVNLSRCSKITDTGIRHLLSIATLKKLCISETGVTADGAATLASLTNLEMLDLGGLPVTDLALSSLQVLTKLRHLNLWGSKVSNEGAVYLKRFPNLRFLNLAWTNVTSLPNLSSLASLNMSNCTIHSLFEGGDKAYLEKVVLSGATIIDFSEAFLHVETNRLSFLDLSYSPLQVFSFLLSMNALTDLNLSYSSLDDDSIKPIASIGPSLKYLNLSGTKVSSAGVGLLAGELPNLETLLLSFTAIDDTAIPYISLMPSLRAINLSNTYVKGISHSDGDTPGKTSSFSALKNLCDLEMLDVEGVKVEDAALSSLTNLGKLSHLFLQHVSLTDASLYQISSLPRLIHIGFRDGVLTDTGLDTFTPPPLLQALDLRGTWLLTEDSLLRFRRKHTQIEVRHELVEAHDKKNLQYSSPSRATARSPKYKHKYHKPAWSPVRSNGIYLDQRLKYRREELLAFQYPASASSASDSS